MNKTKREPSPIPLPVEARPGDGRIFDADGHILCWMGGAGLFKESVILARRDELIKALNIGEKVEALVKAVHNLFMVQGAIDYLGATEVSIAEDLLKDRTRELEEALVGPPAVDTTNHPDVRKSRGAML